MSISLPTMPENRHLLIAFSDLEAFSRIAEKIREPVEVFHLMDDIVRIIASHVEKAGGCYIKTMGDGSLMVFDVADSDAAVLALLALKEAVEEYLRGRGLQNRLRINAHAGEAAFGPFGPRGEIDVYGDEVNRAAGVGSGSYRGEFVMSPETFRTLAPQTRTKFKRHIRETVYRSAEN